MIATKNNIALTSQEEADVKIFGVSVGLDLTGVKVVRNKSLTWRGNVACFSMLHPNTVFIAHDKPILDLMPYVAHELKHREQYNRNRFTYGLAMVISRRAFEAEAYAEEDRVTLELNL